MNLRRGLGVWGILAVVVGSGCASLRHEASDVANNALAPLPTTSTTIGQSSQGCGPTDKDHLPWSFSPADTYTSADLKDLQARLLSPDMVVAGVDENTLPLSYRNPGSDEFKGYEIDVLHAIARALFPTKDTERVVRPIPVITAEKTKVVQGGEVDLTISAVSITCPRWSDVLFTIPYYEATQKVMVRADKDDNAVLSDGTRLPPTPDPRSLDKALSGRRVCATRTDCLVDLQNGDVDAILLHDTFLLGFHQQDPNTTILEPGLGTQDYGIAVRKDRQDLVRFLNRVIVDLRQSHALETFYTENFGPLDAPVAMPTLPELHWLDESS
jgi:polar amino acid transport system substrate-binding protein